MPTCFQKTTQKSEFIYQNPNNLETDAETCPTNNYIDQSSFHHHQENYFLYANGENISTSPSVPVSVPPVPLTDTSEVPDKVNIDADEILEPVHSSIQTQQRISKECFLNQISLGQFSANSDALTSKIFLSLSLSPPVIRRRDMPPLKGRFVSL